MKVDYDIAIIGGGVAGLSLAIQSAEAGYRVVLFEKDTYPAHKVCGEYISMESWDFLQRLGVPLDQWTPPLITRAQVTELSGKEHYYDLPVGGFGLSRYVLDNELYKIALSKGVNVRTQIKVQQISYVDSHFVINTDTEMITSNIAVGAFGKRSNLDLKWKRSFTLQRATKLNNYIAVKYHVRYPAQPTGIVSLHNFKNGYCIVTQVEEGKCCVCYLTTGRNFSEAQNLVTVMQDKILSKNRHLKKLLKESTPLFEKPIAISHISFDKKEQVIKHILMLGDAAGLITPICGNGTSMAMRASVIATKVIDNFLKGIISRKEMEITYAKEWQKTFNPRLSTGRFAQRFSGKNICSFLFLKVINTFPWLAKRLLNAIHGEPF